MISCQNIYPLHQNMNKDLKDKIDNMSQMTMAWKWRFAPSGDPMFQGEVGDYFDKVFKEKGGMTSEISKAIGWK